MFYREYGPWKGISNSGNSLLPDSNVVEDARNVILDKTTGFIRKRDGILLSETLTDQPFGVVARYKESQLGTQDLFIANKRGLTKADLVTNATEALRPFSADLPALQSGDFFSYSIYQNVLYYNYGDFIYKYDGKYHARAGMKALSIIPNTTPVLADNNYKFLVQIADQENEFACLSEINLDGYNLAAGSGGPIYGFQKGEDSIGSASDNWYKNKFMFVDSTKPLTDLYSTTGLDFDVPFTSHNLVVGDKIFMAAISTDSVVSAITPTLTPVLFEVKTINASTISFKNPSGLWVFNNFIALNRLSNIVIYPYMKAPSSSVYQSLIGSFSIGGVIYAEYDFFFGQLEQLQGVSIPLFPYVSGIAGEEWEFPRFSRKALPRCKHISILDGLLFMTCPKVWSQETGAPDEDFDYQTVAWSSENPEDPIETWGGSSIIVGDPSEGRCYATVPNNGALVVFKEKAIYSMEYPIDGLTTVQKAVGATVGCKHPESIKEINGSLLFYVEKRGIYAFNAGGATANELTGPFRGFFKSLTGNAKAVVDELNSRYLLFIESYVIVFDILTNSWWIWTSSNATGGLTYFNNRIVGCDSSKRIYSFVEGQLKDSMGVDTAISAYVLSSWFSANNNEEDKKLKAVRIWALEGTDPILVNAYKNFKSSSVYSETLYGGTGGDIDIAGFLRFESGIRKFKSIAIKLENSTINEDLKISGWVFDFDDLGFESKNFTGAK